VYIYATFFLSFFPKAILDPVLPMAPHCTAEIIGVNHYTKHHIFFVHSLVVGHLDRFHLNNILNQNCELWFFIIIKGFYHLVVFTMMYKILNKQHKAYQNMGKTDSLWQCPGSPHFLTQGLSVVIIPVLTQYTHTHTHTHTVIPPYRPVERWSLFSLLRSFSDTFFCLILCCESAVEMFSKKAHLISLHHILTEFVLMV
jgi:hypothetical protein